MSANFTTLLRDAYKAVGAHEADVLYIYTDFRGLGVHLAEFPSKDAFCAEIPAPFLEAGKTVVMTTFTYTTEGEFHTESTPTSLGAANKWILKQEGCVRSAHPLFSFAALGPEAERLMKNVGKSAFGHDSIHDRLRGENAAFLHVGRPVELGNTILHHVEQVCGATYRMHKAFPTRVFDRGTDLGTDYTAFLRRRDVPGESFMATFTEAAGLLMKSGLVKEVGSPEQCTNISCYGYDGCFDFLCGLFYRDPTIFIETGFIQH